MAYIASAILLVLLVEQSIAEQSNKLLMAQIIYVNGEHMPEQAYANLNWSKIEDWPAPRGALTNTGRAQLYALGEWLRRRYVPTLLSETYVSGELYASSMTSTATIESALANLAGLYTPVGAELWQQDLAWQPVPVHIRPAQPYCTAYERARLKLHNSAEFKRLNESFKDLYVYLANNTEQQVSSFDDVLQINNTLYVAQLYNRPLPAWTRRIYGGARMTWLSNTALQLNTYNRELARLSTGPLLREILERFREKLDKRRKLKLKFWLLAVDAATIVDMLNTLNLYELHNPAYGAALLFELRLNAAGQPFVALFYKNSTAEPHPLAIPCCALQNCTLDQFFEAYDDVLPTDWLAECGDVLPSPQQTSFYRLLKDSPLLSFFLQLII